MSLDPGTLMHVATYVWSQWAMELAQPDGVTTLPVFIYLVTIIMYYVPVCIFTYGRPAVLAQYRSQIKKSIG